MVTEYPLSCNNFAKDAAIIPLPSDEVTPPVTKTYLVFFMYYLVLPKVQTLILLANKKMR
jgi:hypothetical protein